MCSDNASMAFLLILSLLTLLALKTVDFGEVNLIYNKSAWLVKSEKVYTQKEASSCWKCLGTDRQTNPWITIH